MEAYSPIKEKNQVAITKLISFYRKIYLVIAFAFIFVGVIVDVFFLEHAVDGESKTNHDDINTDPGK